MTYETTNDGGPARLAEQISGARAAGTTLPGDTGIDLETGYAIQALRREGRPIVGRKIGMVSPAKRRQFGMSDPIHGPVYPGMVLDGPVDLGRFIQPRLEPELAVVVGADLGPSATLDEVAAAVDGWFVAVDLLDTVWRDYHCQPPEAVADGLNGGAFLLGDQLLPLDCGGELDLRIDGVTLSRGPVADLGDPVARLVWLARVTGGLAEGDVIFLGAPSVNVPAVPGTLEVLGPNDSVLVARLGVR